ncbi:MAG: hypothetical protein AAGF19_04730 [Pseudomonadota bacterium]
MLEWLARSLGAIWFLAGMFGVSWAYGFLIAQHGFFEVFDYSQPSRLFVTLASFLVVLPGLGLYVAGEYFENKRVKQRRRSIRHRFEAAPRRVAR